MPVLVLCLLCALATVARPVSAAPVGGQELAQQEELILLSHGALQLGQALNSVYRTTETQLKEAGYSVGLYGGALGLLGQKVSRGRDVAQELRGSLLELQMEEDALQLQAEATAQELGEAAQGQQELWESLRRLEARLRGARLGHARQELEALKAHTDKQSHIMWVLTGHVQRQRQKMAAQERWLRQIQKRLHTAALPA